MKRLSAVSILIIILFASNALFAEQAEQYVRALKESIYWDNGKIKEYRVYDSEGRIRAKSLHRGDGTLERIERYDIYGHKMEVSLYDGNDRLKTGIDGWAAMRWKYDNDGKLVGETSYDEEGKAIERRIFSESGRLLARMLMDDGKNDDYARLRAEPVYGRHLVTFYNPDGSVEGAAVVGE